ncbi:alpha/beta-hydrolase family protein [Propionibacterium sp.]|uniref:alpha/beta-hydrolase family protein n=1 Tax=Propionibacterium sp. TaxID=1977903 RepID=UPI0039E858F1
MARHLGRRDPASELLRAQLFDRLVDWRAAHLRGLSVAGTTGGLIGYVAAYSPSLLPRSTGFQGLIGALSAMFGYQTGLLVSWMTGVLADLFGVQVRLRRGKRIWLVAGLVVLAAALVGIPLASLRSQRRTARYCRAEGPSASWAIKSTGAASLILALFILQWRGTVAAIDWGTTHLNNRITWTLLARMVSTLIVLGTIVVVFDQVILRGVIGVGRTASERVDQTTPLGVTQPTDPSRSGSPSSPEHWDGLGLQGKRFVSGGPDRARIEEVTGRPALQPLRAYAALNGRDLHEIARAAIAEMDREGAWERSAISIVTTTGRGNVNEWSASAFEYLTGGDCCTVATQYSGLPSAITLFTGKETPMLASRILFEAVEARVKQLPRGKHPKLYLGGESLGAYGSNGIFETPEDMLSRIDGAVWLGTPDFTPMHQLLTARRAPGSTAVNPVIDGGRNVRFAKNSRELLNDEFGTPLDAWQHPRVVYLQNDTDPVVWWSTTLLWRHPQWLDDRRVTNSPMARMHWLPFVTFWQVASDMPVCRNVPEGYGHKYHAAQVTPAWAGVLGLPIQDDHSAIIEALLHDITLKPTRVMGI